MPELPEVESVRRGLAEAALEARVVDVFRSASPLRIGAAWRREHEHVETLLGAIPGEVERRGKYVVWRFAPRGGGEALGLLVHLGMSGRLGVAHRDEPRVVHTHLVLRFADDRELRFVDPRRFGALRVAPWSTLLREPPLGELGPEPIDPDFGGAVLRERLAHRTIPIRDALLDQRAVAGVGNIYAVEACFEAGIDPRLAASRLPAWAWDELARALRLVLLRGIEHGGTSLKDFRNVTGEPGRNQDDLRVYGRAGAPCPRCGAPLVPGVSQARSFVWCRVCQPRRPRRPGV
jgi:formamidopyrimidine-DNA glycosylase